MNAARNAAQRVGRRFFQGLRGLTLRETCCLLVVVIGISVIFRLVRQFLHPPLNYVEYDLNSASDDVFLCPELALPPLAGVRVCLHADSDDGDVSTAVRYEGCWRRPEMDTFYRAVRREPEYGVIDIGAGIGVHTVIAASQGRPVLAVEPQPDSVFRLHKTLMLARATKRVRLLVNAVSNVTRPALLSWPEGHVTAARVLPEGARCAGERCARTHVLTLDALLPYVSFPAAFLVISTSGDEAAVLAGSAARLFSRLRIPLVFMDFGAGRRTCQDAAAGRLPVNSPAVRTLGAAIHFLFEREYLPHHGATGKLLEGTRCQTWPATTVVWEHVTFRGSYI